MKRFVFAAVPVLALSVAQVALAQQPALRPSAKAAGAVVQVHMQMQGSKYMFVPSTLTIHQGDVVEFVNVSGFPHDVMFDAAHIPAGAAAVLNSNMANRMGSLQGPMMTQPHQTYRVSFAGAPVGTYAFYCLPHRALGMTGTITVTAARH